MKNTNNYSVQLEALIGTNYIKYANLSTLIQIAYQGSTADTLNIFIDMYSVLKPLYTSGNGNHIQIQNELELSSTIINMCSHYRQFFNGLGVKTYFYIINGFNNPIENLTFYPGYNSKFMDKFMSTSVQIQQMIDNNMQALEVLCPYLPGIYYFNIKDKEVAGFIEFLIHKYKFNDRSLYPNLENLIITKDVLPLQLVPLGCTILRPQKYKGSDISFIINHKNFWNSFIGDMRSKINFTPHMMFISNILAMTKIPERSMSSIKTIPSTFHTFEKMISLGYLNNDGTVYTQDTINQVLAMIGIGGNYQTYTFRWKAISSNFAATCIIPANPVLSNMEPLDFNSPEDVKNIVNEYYKNCPIDLDRL